MGSQVVITAEGVLVRARAEDSGMHAHRALQLVWAPEAPFRLETDDQRVEVDWAVIEPMRRHRISGHGQALVHLFLDPGLGHLRRWLRSGQTRAPDEMLQQRLRAWSDEPEAVAGVGRKDESGSDPDLISAWRAHSLPGLVDGVPGDARIRTAARLIENTPTDIHWHHRQLAAQVHLSPSRFQALFRAHTGQSVQQFVLWQRLLMGLRRLGAGDSVTAAAQTCGFSDSAHFSRSFRRILGAAPSEIRLLNKAPADDCGNWSG